jgi:hypothetical protein
MLIKAFGLKQLTSCPAIRRRRGVFIDESIGSEGRLQDQGHHKRKAGMADSKPH